MPNYIPNMLDNFVKTIKKWLSSFKTWLYKKLKIDRKLGSVVLNGGQKLFELHVRSGNLTEISLVDAVINKRTGSKTVKVKLKKGCDYFKSYSRKAAEAKAKARYLKKY